MAVRKCFSEGLHTEYASVHKGSNGARMSDTGQKIVILSRNFDHASFATYFTILNIVSFFLFCNCYAFWLLLLNRFVTYITGLRIRLEGAVDQTWQ